jgi:hypothetical protein
MCHFSFDDYFSNEKSSFRSTDGCVSAPIFCEFKIFLNGGRNWRELYVRGPSVHVDKVK